jgi:hypothetical protein
MPVINSIAFKKKHNIDPQESLSLSQISKLSGFPMKALQEVYNRGIGAAKTTGITRPQVTSKEQWAYARVYSFVMKRKSTFDGSDRDIAEKYKL